MRFAWGKLFDRPPFLMFTQNRKTVILIFDHKNEEIFVRSITRMERLHHIGGINDQFFLPKNHRHLAPISSRIECKTI